MELYEQCKEYINNLYNETIELYTGEKLREFLIEHCNLEKRDIKGYHGREILELLQNADDAYQKSIDLGNKPKKELQVEIKYQNSILSVSNTGTVFDEKGILAIVQGNNSDKDGGYIGNKGTGFRSILNWSNLVRIKSGFYDIEFSKEHAKNVFNKIKDTPQVIKQIAKYKKRDGELYVPMLSAPVFCPNGKYYEKTSIEISIDQNTNNDDFSVIKQLKQIDINILLFLPNISSILIVTDEGTAEYKRNILKNSEERNLGLIDRTSTLVLTKSEDKVDIFTETYNVYNRKILECISDGGKKRDIQSIIAIPNNKENLPNNVYTYFPLLSTGRPFNCIMHATYNLGDQRNTINSTDKNKQIIIKQLEHLLSIVDFLIENKEYEEAYHLLVPTTFNNYYWNFAIGFDAYNLQYKYYELVSNLKIFVSVNGDRLSLNEEPKIIFKNIPSCFKGEHYNKLVTLDYSDSLKAFIQKLAFDCHKNINCSEQDLLEAVNKSANTWTIDDRVECFDWWNNTYTDSLPNLIQTQKGEYINLHDPCYFLEGDFDDIEIPYWVDIPSIDKEYQTSLLKVAGKRDDVKELKESKEAPSTISRIITTKDIYNLVDFKSRDRSNIIPTINSSVKNYDNAIDFIIWLWMYYSDDIGWNPIGVKEATIKYNFPTEDGVVSNSDSLYLKTDINTDIFSSDYKQFKDINYFASNSEEKIKFEKFILKFGVVKYPKLFNQNIELKKEYQDSVISKIRISHSIEKYKSVSLLNNSIPYIKCIDEILPKLKMLDVFKWLNEDEGLYSHLYEKEYMDSEYDIQFRKTHAQKPINYDKKIKIKNYLLFVFNSIKWIEIDGAKYRPNEVVLDYSLKTPNVFKGLVPILSEKMVNQISVELDTNTDRIYNIIKLFDFCESVTDLNSNSFYELLFNIQNLSDKNRAIDLARKIYRQVETRDNTLRFESCDKQKDFFENGKVLTRNHGFQLAKDVYVPSAKIVNRNTTFIIDKGPRTNNDKFIQIFNCKEYNKEPIIIESSIEYSMFTKEFEEYFANFKRFILPYIENSTSLKKVYGTLTVKLVSEIKVEVDGTAFVLNDECQELRQSISKWYIVYTKNELDYLQLSFKIQNIIINIANTTNFNSSRIGELFRISNEDDRKRIMIEEFGTLDVIEGVNLTEDIKNNFLETVHSIDESYTVSDDINFNDLNSFDTISKILLVLKAINVNSFSEFKAKGFQYSIDSFEYYRSKVREIRNDQDSDYKNYLYHNSIGNDEKEKDFLKNYYLFHDFELKEKIDSIIEPIDILKKKFGEWQKVDIDCEKQYSKNYDELNTDNKFADDIANSFEARCYIYFKKTDKFENWLTKQTTKEKEEYEKGRAPYSKFADVIPKEFSIEYREEKAKQERKGHKHHGAFSKSRDDKERKNKKRLGNAGELLIYNLLRSKYGDNVIPKSEAFVDLKIIKPGQGLSENCDIEYTDPKDNHKYFVEVKSGDSNGFDISPNELEFAKNNPENYMLYIVYDLDAENPKYHVIDKKFWENKKYRREDIIERIHFEF